MQGKKLTLSNKTDESVASITLSLAGMASQAFCQQWPAQWPIMLALTSVVLRLEVVPPSVPTPQG